jgi:hypothetical protein
MIPVQAFLDVSEENDTLSMYLNRQTFNRFAIDGILELRPALLAKKNLIHQSSLEALTSL